MYDFKQIVKVLIIIILQMKTSTQLNLSLTIFYGYLVLYTSILLTRMMDIYLISTLHPELNDLKPSLY